MLPSLSLRVSRHNDSPTLDLSHEDEENPKLKRKSSYFLIARFFAPFILCLFFQAWRHLREQNELLLFIKSFVIFTQQFLQVVLIIPPL